MEKDLVAEFDIKRDVYNSFAKTVADLLERLLLAKKTSYHSISFRCKARDSFERKVDAKQRYNSLDEITDLAGARIITHFSDDVDVVASMVESEFKIDRANSIDKRAALDPDRFGYLSLHYVVSLKREREKLQEYSAFKGLKIEIQIRSILQHTWAEIEHDIGYKSSVEVPRGIRRKFSRMAGLLELADQEFVSIRSELQKYEKSVKLAIIKNPAKVALDKVTYLDFVNSDAKCISIDSAIADVCNFTFFEEPKNVARQLDGLMFFSLDTIEQLKKALVDNEEDIMRRAADVAALNTLRDKPAPISRGISIFYLTQVLAANSKDPELIEAFLTARKIGGPKFTEYLLEFSR
jgi:ppGpp synthetase/RelA/SpoT-type nucleotidyltranferase